MIADSIETVCGAMNHDGLLAFGGCDKNMPGCVMAMARLNVPSVFVYGGSILPGVGPAGEDVDIVSIFEAVGKFQAGTIDEKTLHKVECASCPGHGSCGGMYTANTMASAIEAMGLSLPYGASQPRGLGREGARGVPGRAGGGAAASRRTSGPRDLITRKSLENAYTFVLALGGSTNAVLHLMAIAREAGVTGRSTTSTGSARRCRTSPTSSRAGKYVMFDLYRVGGTPAVHEGAAREGLSARRLPDRDRARRSPRTWPTCRACSRSRRRWCGRSRSRCSTTASS